MISQILLFLLFSFSVNNTNIHQYSIQALDSDEQINLSDFKGKKILIVNVASKCGYTPQYEALQELYMQHSDKLVVVGFPCDQFMGQELNSESEIRSFCTNEFQVTFPITTVVEVKGKDQHPIYQWLTKQSMNGKGDFKVSWNFNKFLIDEEGNLLEHFSSKVKPKDEAIMAYLK